MFDKKGCQVILGVVGLFMIIGLVNTGTCTGLVPGMQDGSNSTAESQVVAEIAGRHVTTKEIDDQEAQARRNPQAQNGPGYDFFLLTRVLDQSLSQAAIGVIAEQKGLKVTDEVLKLLLDDQFKSSLADEKLRLIQEKKLKEGHTEKEFVEAFKKESKGKTPDEFKAERLQAMLDRFKDPTDGPGFKNQILGILLSEWYEKEQNKTLDDLKKTFDNFNIKRLAFDDPKLTVEQKTEAAKKAVAEIKGGMKFEDALAKYNKGLPSAALPYGRELLDREVSFRPILNLKAGEVSEPLVQGSTVAVYKLINITQSVPADFEKTKEKKLKEFRGQKSSETMQADVDAMKESKLVWKDPGVELAYSVFKIQNEGTRNITTAKLNELLESLAKKATNTTATTGLGDRMLVLARYSAFEAYFPSLSPDKQTEAREERAEILQSVLERSESNEVRLQLYDNFLVMKSYESAGSALLDAAKYNSGTDEMSVRATGEIRLRTDKAEKEGKIEKVVITSIRKEITRWEQERIEDDKAQKDSAKQSDSNVDKELDKMDDPEVAKNKEASKPGSKK